LFTAARKPLTTLPTQHLSSLSTRSNEVVIAPPTAHLSTFQSKLRKDIAVASQDAFPTTGAHTGETPVALLKDMGLNYAIIGHSERRQKGETDEVVANKVKAAVDAGITAIACIGETLAERDAGKTIEVVERQLKVRACILCVKQSSCMLLFR